MHAGESFSWEKKREWRHVVNDKSIYNLFTREGEKDGALARNMRMYA